jgi:arginase family enzyme
MLSGMPVAIAIGLCLQRLCKQAGLDFPIVPRDVVMIGVRANDPLEQQLIDQSWIEMVPVDDVKRDCRQLRAAMNSLNSTVDLIYIHFDADPLDQSEVPSMRLTEPNGTMRTELAAALELIMAYPKVARWGSPTSTLKGMWTGRWFKRPLL